MAGVFACPECGQELAVEGLSPGREVLCDVCSTWVEVPYLPRAGDSRIVRRTIQRSPWDTPLLKVAIAFAVVALLGLVASKMIAGHLRSGQEKVLDDLVAAAKEAEDAHDYDTAFIKVEAALTQARSMKLEGSSRFDDLAERRDQIARREIKDRLATIDTLDPDQAVGEALILAERAAKSPALSALADEIDARLATARLRQAEADLAKARKAFDEGRDGPAFEAAARLHDRTGELSRSDASRYQAEALSILERTVARKGVALPPVVGRFGAGSVDEYNRILDRPRADSLRIKGYLPEPRNSPWSKLWADKAPFRATVVIVETQEDLYLQSKNRTTQVDGTFELFQGSRSLWKNRAIARTREPIPDLPALLAGHIGTADKRKPETERLLHDDALKQFLDQTGKILKGMPAREGSR